MTSSATRSGSETAGLPDQTDDSVSQPAIELPEIADFHERVASAIDESCEEVNRDVDALREMIASMAATHRRAADAVTVDEGSAVEQWRSLRVYRVAVADHLLAAMHRKLGELRIEETVQDAVHSCHSRLRDIAWRLPTTVKLPDVTSIYEIVADESPARRVQKRVELLKRRARKFMQRLRHRFRGAAHRDSNQRTVDLRWLAEFHVRVRIAEAIETEHRRVQLRIVDCIGKLEEALARWSLEQLAVEHVRDAPEFHRPTLAPASEPSGEEDEDDDTSTSAPNVAESVVALGDTLDGTAIELDALGFSVAGRYSDFAAAFDRDVRYAGTFLLKKRRRRLPRPARLPEFKTGATAIKWRAWHADVLARVDALTHLIRLREHLIETEDALLNRVADATLRPVFEAFEQLRNALRRAIENTAQACEDHGRKQDVSSVAGELRTIQTRTLGVIEETLRHVPGVMSAHDVLREPGQPEWERILETIETLPGNVKVHRLREDPNAPIDLDVPEFTMNLQAIARDALDPPLPVQLAEPARPLGQRIVQVWDEIAKVEDIVRFNLDATLDELAAGEGGEGGKDEERSPVGRARELATDALRRSVNMLDELSTSLAGPWHTLESAVFEAFQDDWWDVQRRIRSEGAVEERWVGIRTRLSRGSEQVWRAVRARMVKLRDSLLRRSKVAWRSLRKLIARGQAAVGVAETGADESIATLDAISDVVRLQAKLPLVYRRLFSFEPVTELSLFEARSRDLVRARRHFERWEGRHDAGVLVLSGTLAGGRTSFLYAIGEKLMSRAEVTYLSLDRRVNGLEDFATALGNTLGVTQSVGSLDELEDALMARGRGDMPSVCMLDNLEHLILQGGWGTDLMEDVLMFLSRTDAVVYWVTTIAREAWYFVEKTAESAAGFVTDYPLTSIDRTMIEDIIMHRHRRSGIPVTFQEPELPSPILRQRLKRARTPERRQEILRKDYFDALYAATQQDLPLAFFYWIRSADFNARPDELTVMPLEVLSFRFLDNLDSNRSFTLKAFIVHNTMTVEEHASIFRLPVDESSFILESLLNERLIEPVNSDSRSSEEAGVEPGQPYRINRLILQPVLEHLRNRHFVY